MDIKQYIIYFLLVAFLSFLSILTKKITVLGALVGGIITLMLWIEFGVIGILSIATFFAFGTLASHFKQNEKRAQNLEEDNQGKRDYSNVLGNAGVVIFIILLAKLFPQNNEVYLLMMLSCFASALSDTFSSEFGNVYGKKFFSINSFQKGIKGKDGVISLEGSIFGLIGSLIISVLFYSIYHDLVLTQIILIAGVIGNVTDSILGGTLQKKGVLNNHSVNFMSTLSASMISLVLFYLFVK